MYRLLLAMPIGAQAGYTRLPVVRGQLLPVQGAAGFEFSLRADDNRSAWSVLPMQVDPRAYKFALELYRLMLMWQGLGLPAPAPIFFRAEATVARLGCAIHLTHVSICSSTEAMATWLDENHDLPFSTQLARCVNAFCFHNVVDWSRTLQPAAAVDLLRDVYDRIDDNLVIPVPGFSLQHGTYIFDVVNGLVRSSGPGTPHAPSGGILSFPIADSIDRMLSSMVTRQCAKTRQHAVSPRSLLPHTGATLVVCSNTEELKRVAARLRRASSSGCRLKLCVVNTKPATTRFSLSGARAADVVLTTQRCISSKDTIGLFTPEMDAVALARTMVQCHDPARHNPSPWPMRAMHWGMVVSTGPPVQCSGDSIWAVLDRSKVNAAVMESVRWRVANPFSVELNVGDLVPVVVDKANTTSVPVVLSHMFDLRCTLHAFISHRSGSQRHRLIRFHHAAISKVLNEQIELSTSNIPFVGMEQVRELFPGNTFLLDRLDKALEDEEERRCVVCSDRTTNVLLSCGHMFCIACWNQYSRQKVLCPCCRVEPFLVLEVKELFVPNEKRSLPSPRVEAVAMSEQDYQPSVVYTDVGDLLHTLQTHCKSQVCTDPAGLAMAMESLGPDTTILLPHLPLHPVPLLERVLPLFLERENRHRFVLFEAEASGFELQELSAFWLARHCRPDNRRQHA